MTLEQTVKATCTQCKAVAYGDDVSGWARLGTLLGPSEIPAFERGDLTGLPPAYRGEFCTHDCLRDYLKRQPSQVQPFEKDEFGEDEPQPEAEPPPFPGQYM